VYGFCRKCFSGNFSHTKKYFPDFSVNRENISIEFFLTAPFFPGISRTQKKYFPGFPGWEKNFMEFFLLPTIIVKKFVRPSLCCSINSHNFTHARIASLPAPRAKHRFTKTTPRLSSLWAWKNTEGFAYMYSAAFSHAFLDLQNISGSRKQGLYLERYSGKWRRV